MKGEICMLFHMLIIDDNASITQGINDIVTAHFSDVFFVHKAENGADALRYLRDYSIAIVITDIKMPVMDGIRLLHVVKKYGLACEVVALSGYDDYSLVRDVLRSGAYDYLLKPININMFIKIINELIPVIKNKVFSRALIEPMESEAQLLPKEQSVFFDLPNGGTLSKTELKLELQKAMSAALSMDSDHAAACLSDFFRGVSEPVMQEEEIRKLLIQFVYSLMERNQAFIKIVSSYKLSEHDAVACVKSLPTLSQLKKRFCATIERYVSDMKTTDGSTYQFIIKKACGYISEHYAKNLTLSEVAEHLHIHPNYFSTLFKSQTGITFRDYLRNVRIEKSKTMITESQIKLNDIAFQTGYQDVSHYNRAFKKVTGISPSNYRRQILNNLHQF